MSQDAPFGTMGGGTLPPAPPSPSGGGCGDADPPGPITLAVPRPEHERARNVYVDVPFQHKVLPRSHGFLRGGPGPHNLPLVHGTSLRTSLQPRSQAKAAGTPSQDLPSLQKSKRGLGVGVGGGSGSVVASQPLPSLTFTKGAPEEDSIICGRCGRCRCEACSVPRPPTGTWVCGGKCHLSSATAVDYLSCLCCVKGLLYHCGKDAGEGGASPFVDRPCSCSGGDACSRWACLALAALPLPCLVCYWPLRGVRALFEKTYQRFTTQGCRCRPSPVPPRRMEPLPAPPPEKRLLHDCA